MGLMSLPLRFANRPPRLSQAVFSRALAWLATVCCLWGSPAGAALIAEYTFEDGSITSSTGNFHLTAEGTAPGFGINFYRSDGIPDNYLWAQGPGGQPEFTVSLWARTDSVNQGSFKGLFTSRFANNTNVPPGATGASSDFSWQIDSHGGQYRLASQGVGVHTFGDVEEDTWQHLVLRKSGGNSGEIWLDGELISSFANPGGLHHFILGRNRVGDHSYLGDIANVQIWDSAEDVAAIFAAGPGIVPEPGRAMLLVLAAMACLARRNGRPQTC